MTDETDTDDGWTERYEDRTRAVEFDKDDETPVTIDVDGYGGLHIRIGEETVAIGPKTARTVRDTIHEQVPDGDVMNPHPTGVDPDADADDDKPTRLEGEGEGE